MTAAQPIDDEGIRNIMVARGIRDGIEWPLAERLVARIRQEQAKVAVLGEEVRRLHVASVLDGDMEAWRTGPLNPDPAADRLLAEAALGRAYFEASGRPEVHANHQVFKAVSQASVALMNLYDAQLLAQEAANV